jgi:geranylgeranyl pyrophosphate synthase
VLPQVDQFLSIWKIIERIWSESGAWPDFVDAMHSVLSRQFDRKEFDSAVWTALPGLCCQAAGGDPQLAEPVAAAWLLFFMAAHLMDSLEDQDELDPWWQSWGVGAAINLTTGLYFSASLALQELCTVQLDRQTVHQVTQIILRPFLVMCSGQHQDLTGSPASLDHYWRIAGAKSGEFFAIACHSGARLATDREDILDGFHQFGFNFGLLLQVLDDLKDYQDLSQMKRTVDCRALSRSLPAVYVREVCPEGVRDRFDQLLQCVDDDPDSVASLTQVIEENGGTLYLLVELDKYRDLALAGLDIAGVQGQPRKALVAMLDKLYSPSS